MAELDKTLEAAARSMCVEGGFDPDEIMANDGPRWRYYVPGAEAAISAYLSSTSAGVTEEQREHILETVVAPDNGTVPEVLAAVLQCARAWVPEARIVGNVRAGDIARAIEAALEASRVAPVCQKEAEPVCKHCKGTGAEADYVGLEMRCVAVACSACGGSGHLPSPAPAVEPVGIKALEWTEMPERPYGYKGFLLYRIDSTNSLLNYRITYAVQGELDRFGKPWTQRYADYPRYELDAPHGSKGGNFGTLEAAKAAAQSDYEARIRSVLHPSPTPVSAPVGVVGAAPMSPVAAHVDRQLTANGLKSLVDPDAAPAVEGK
jgi:hypothetical protein